MCFSPEISDSAEHCASIAIKCLEKAIETEQDNEEGTDTFILSFYVGERYVVGWENYLVVGWENDVVSAYIRYCRFTFASIVYSSPKLSPVGKSRKMFREPIV